MKPVVVFGLSALALSFLIVGADAQSTRALNAAARRVDEFNKQSEKVERDEMGREMAGRKPSAEELKRVAAINAQINEDLQTLQTVYNDLVTKLKSRETLSGPSVIEYTNRINQSSERLKKNLNFPKPQSSGEGEKKLDHEFGDVRKDLALLCSHLFKFVMSPYFENPRAIEPQVAQNTQHHLEMVIEISGRLKQNAN